MRSKIWGNTSTQVSPWSNFSCLNRSKICWPALGPPVSTMVVSLGICTANPQGPTHGLPPGAHKLRPLVRGDYRGGTKRPPLILTMARATLAPVRPTFLSGMATIHPECLSTHTIRVSKICQFCSTEGSENRSRQTEHITAGVQGWIR